MASLLNSFFFGSLFWLTIGYLDPYADATQITVLSTGCPISGPLLPRPTNLLNSSHVKNATEDLVQILDSAVTGDINAGWDVQNTSFSVAFVSPNGEPGDGGTSVVWDYHHLAERSTNGTTAVDGDSQYLVGSVSKVFSALLLHKVGVSLQDPITDYLLELGDSSSIRWKDITLGSLAAHLAGIPPNPEGSFDWYFLAEVYQKLGLPRLEEKDYPECGVPGLNQNCNRDGLLQQVRLMEPVDQPYSRPIYSQLSFMLSSLALGERTGKNYSQLLQETIIGPLGLENTGVSPGVDERAVIPPIEGNGWGTDYGLSAPGGGLYSSTNDLSTLVSSILDYSVLKTPDDVRKWLLPKSMTSSPGLLIGDPWEIQRTTDLCPKHPHTIDIHGKGGGAWGYASQISVIDQYGVGVVVLTAGPVDSAAVTIINKAVISTIIPAVEQEAREQAEVYAGKYSTPDAPADEDHIEMIISMDAGPGLKLDALHRNGSDIRSALHTIWSFVLPMFDLSPTFRMYPTGIKKRVPGSEHILQQEWRISFDPIPPGQGSGSELPGQDKLGEECPSWQTTDWVYYGARPVDKIVFTVNTQDREVIGVEVPFLRSGMLGKSK